MSFKAKLLRGYLADLEKAQRKLRPKLIHMAATLSNAIALQARVNLNAPIDTWRIMQATGAVEELANTMTLVHFMAEHRTKKSARRQIVSLDLTASVKAIYSEVNAATIEYLQARYNTRAIEILKGAGEYADIRLRETISQGLADGVTTKAMIGRLRETLDSIGLGTTSKFQVETIARTQIQLALSAGRDNALRDDDIQEILWGYTYITVGDDRVREEHDAIDNVTLPKNHPFWEVNMPPNGWNCRCQVVPLFERERVVNPPDDYQGPDEDFNFNPGNVFRSIF